MKIQTEASFFSSCVCSPGKSTREQQVSEPRLGEEGHSPMTVDPSCGLVICMVLGRFDFAAALIMPVLDRISKGGRDSS